MGAGRNAGKRVVDDTAGPWSSWRVKSRAARAIRFIETYCVLSKGHGAGKPMKLAPFQRDWLEEVYSSGITSAAMEIPRGNGKSTFLAAVALHALCDEDDGGQPQVPIVATTVAQAMRTVFGPACDMADKNPVIGNRLLRYSAIGNQKLVMPTTGGEMFPVSNDPDGLQGLDPSLAVCDEIGFMPLESWDSLILAGGKRPSSLVVGIGTPGFDRKSALWHLRTRILEGSHVPGFSFTEYSADEGCDIRDEAQWAKANPAMASGYKSSEHMRTAVEMSLEAHFRIFHLGQWVDGVECWLGDDGRAVWDRLRDPWVADSGPMWLGVDVALKHDSTAVVSVQLRPDERYHVKATIWQPREDGRLDVTDVMQHIREVCGKNDVREVAYDPRFFDLPAQMLVDEGLPMVEFPQVLERLTPAVTLAYEAIKRGEVAHDGDEPFSTQVLNAVARFNERGFTLSKGKSRDRIDACVAMVMALSRAMDLEPAGQVGFGVYQF